MAIKILPSSEVRDRIATVLRELKKSRQPVFITQRGKAAAVLVDIDQYNTLMEVLEDMEDIADFRMSEGEKSYDFEQFISKLEGKD